MSTLLLDTNAYTQFLAGNTEILSLLSMADTLYMSVFVLGELYAGFRGGSKEKENRKILNDFLGKPTVKKLFATTETADFFGHIKHTLKLAGTPIPINDIWIAAHAMETGSLVVTYDKHFEQVAGIRIASLK